MVACLILLAHPQSKDWAAQLLHNQADTLRPGRANDPRPTNLIATGDVHIQTVTSILFVSPMLFNGVAYGIFALLLLLLIWALRRIRSEMNDHLLALAGLSALSLLAIYHRHYDTRLLLLTVPYILIVFDKWRFLGRAITLTTMLAIVCVQCRFQEYFQSHGAMHAILQRKIVFILLLRQQNLAILLVSCFYVIAAFTIQFRRNRIPSTSTPLARVN